MTSTAGPLLRAYLGAAFGTLAGTVTLLVWTVVSDADAPTSLLIAGTAVSTAVGGGVIGVATGTRPAMHRFRLVTLVLLGILGGCLAGLLVTSFLMALYSIGD